MAWFRGTGARKDATRGTTPLESRKGNAGMFTSTSGIGARPGVLPGAPAVLVTGTAGFTYSVDLAHVLTSRSASDGAQLFGNDGVATVATGVAPGSGSRIDIIYVLHPANLENSDTTSAPVLAVAQGTASGSPVAPSIPTGALELARNTMASSATSTASAGNAISQTFPWTAVRGTPVGCRNQSERDALTKYEGLTVDRLDTHLAERWNGTAWGMVSAAGTMLGTEYDPGSAVTNAIGSTDTLVGTGVLFTLAQQRRVRIVTRCRFFASTAGQIVYLRTHVIAGASAVVAGSTGLGIEAQTLTAAAATGYGSGVTVTHEHTIVLIPGTYTAFPVGGSPTGATSSFASPYTAVYDAGPV